MILTSENYYTPEMQMHYMGCSQIKDFIACQSCAMAKITEQFQEEQTTALLVGSYVDAHFEGTLDVFKAKNPSIFKKDGNLKAEYLQANKMIERVERDELFMKYMAGEKQVIMTGEILDVPFKIKIDSYHKDKCIVDLKTVKNFENIWDDKRGKLSFIEYWRYDLQGAIYQEIVYQNTGKRLPFYIAAVTKEKEPDLEIFQIPQAYLDAALDEVKPLIPKIQQIKKGEIEPERCGHCDWCKFTKVLTGVISCDDLIFAE